MWPVSPWSPELVIMAGMDILRSPSGTSQADCQHVPEELATPTAQHCEECDSSHSLRMCATCGHVGCCESLAGHAEAHYGATGHEVMASLPLGRGFLWCYAHGKYVG
jgi:uncharacterized UBP type Zn finger protein